MSLQGESVSDVNVAESKSKRPHSPSVDNHDHATPPKRAKDEQVTISVVSNIGRSLETDICGNEVFSLRDLLVRDMHIHF